VGGRQVATHLLNQFDPDQLRCWTCAALWRNTLTVKRQKSAPEKPGPEDARRIGNLRSQVSFDIGPRCIGRRM